MTSDMNSIMVGYQGTRDMLRAVHGIGEDEQPAHQPGPPRRVKRQAPALEVPVIVGPVENLPKLTPAAFDKMFVEKQQRGKLN